MGGRANRNVINRSGSLKNAKERVHLTSCVEAEWSHQLVHLTEPTERIERKCLQYGVNTYHQIQKAQTLIP